MQACEDCGSEVVVGQEWVAPDSATRDELGEAALAQGVDWCTNVSCPSNAALRGFMRKSANEYECLECGVTITAYLDRVLAHRRLHMQQ